jgi:drug/metabolite transporter (DMT)-like permease
MIRPAPPSPISPAPTAAILFMLAATALLAATTLLAKALGTDALGPPLHPVQVTFGRFLFAWLALIAVFAALRPTLTRVHWPLHTARVACGFTGVTLMFAAAAMIPLADATAISFLNPVFCMLLAIPLLGERVGPWRWTAAAIALVGALVLIRPGATVEVGALLALGAALIIGLELIFIKRLSGREAPLQLLLISNSIGVLIATLAVLWVWQPPTPAQWAGMAALGLTMAAAQFCFVNSMARADASFVTPFTYLTLVFAALYDAALFGVLPDAISLLGAAIILTGAALLAWRDRVNRARSH